jgi:hypothetical protein
MAQHVRIVAILHIVFGGIGIALGLIGLLFFGGIAGVVGATHDPDAVTAIPILGAIGGLIFIFFLIISVPDLIAGIGLLKFRPWARILTLILSALHLLNVPIGTALGIYSFWALLARDSERLFQPPATVPAPRM